MVRKRSIVFSFWLLLPEKKNASDGQCWGASEGEYICENLRSGREKKQAVFECNFCV